MTVLVVSCDKYRDTWAPVVTTMEEFWPDCPFDIRLLTNNLDFDHPRIISLRTGDDVDWSSNLLLGLESLRSSHVLLWLDDVFPSARIDTSAVDRALRYAVDKGASFVRLRPEPEPPKWNEAGFGELGSDASYRVSVFATIWRVEVLARLLRRGENPWQFELRGTERARDVEGFYSIRQPVFRYIHGIEKGLWLREAATWLARRGMPIDESYRRKMRYPEHLKYRFGRVKHHLMRLVPEKHRKSVLRVARNIYLALGLRRPEYYR